VPQKLRGSSESDICEACRRAELDRKPQEVKKPKFYDSSEVLGTVLPSSTEQEIRSLKYRMVISLCEQQGRFWDLIREVREERAITPKTKIPDPDLDPIDPERPLLGPSPYTPEGGPDPYGDDQAAYREWILAWHRDVQRIIDEMLPAKHRGKGAHWEWGPFVAACILHNPPDDKLLEFLAVGGPEPTAVYGDHIPDDAEDIPQMIAPPVKTLAELMELEDGAWGPVLYWVKESMESCSIEPLELLALISQKDPELQNRYLRSLLERGSDRIFIEYDPSRSKRDYEHALKMLESTVGSRSRSGRPGRDEMVAYQCAVLHDRLGWTLERIAEYLGLVSIDTAERHVTDGREAAKRIR
jgi:hypothetical protein